MNKATLKIRSVLIGAGMMLVATTVPAQTVTGTGGTLSYIFYSDLFDFDDSGKEVMGDWTYTRVADEQPKSRYYDQINSVHFAISESLLTIQDYGTYNTTRRPVWGAPIQIPVALVPLALPFHSPASMNLPALDLTRDQVCKIFANKYLTWGQLLGTTDQTPLQVVYQTAPAGSTEIIANFLSSEACSGYGFQKSSNFATVVQNAGGIGPNWIAVIDDEGMENFLARHSGVGYISPDWAFAPDDPKHVASIEGTLPVSARFSEPTLPPISYHRRSPLSWVPAYTLPHDRSIYPIYGTTNLLIGQCYQGGTGPGSTVEAIRDFIARLTRGEYDKQLEMHRFKKMPSNVDPSLDWYRAIEDAFLNPASELSIGNISVCNGIGRP